MDTQDRQIYYTYTFGLSCFMGSLFSLFIYNKQNCPDIKLTCQHNGIYTDMIIFGYIVSTRSTILIMCSNFLSKCIVLLHIFGDIKL